MSVIDEEFALRFAHEWIAAWNSHDLVRILSHYSDDFEFSSPKIVEIAGEPSGRLKGKEAIGAYWAKALVRIPDLRFELINVLCGINALVIVYRGAAGKVAAEVFEFRPDGKVCRSSANYASSPSNLAP